MEWINVKDKLPEEHLPVWVQFKGHQGPSIGCVFYVDSPLSDESGWAWAMAYDPPIYHNGKWEGDCEFDDEYEALFWAFLPEPPKTIEQ